MEFLLYEAKYKLHTAPWKTTSDEIMFSTLLMQQFVPQTLYY